MFKEILDNTRKKNPLIHCITNYVTANDCANMLFACNASPCMADAEEEVSDIVKLASGVAINLGTLSSARFEAMLIAGAEASKAGKPIVFDPVGSGSSVSRTASAREFLTLVKPTVIRGNLSEIRSLSDLIVKHKPLMAGMTRGVDSPLNDFKDAVKYSIDLAKNTGSIVVVTGPTDIITDGVSARFVSNGCDLMKKITGAGCMMSVVMAAFISANPDNLLDSVTAASGAMGICGEIAKERMKPEDGNASFRNYLIDAMYNLDPEVLESRIKYRTAEAQI